MAITYFNQYSLQPGTTSLSMAPPATTLAGDMAVVYCVSKLSGVVPTVSSGTLIGSNTVGTGADGAGTGLVRLSCWYTILTGTAPTTTITIASGNSATGGGMVYRKAAADTWAIPTALWGTDTSSGTGFVATATVQDGYRVGDWLIAVGGTTLNTTLNARGITLPGATVTYTGINSGGTANGNQCFLWTDHEVVTAGAQTGLAAVTGTLAAASTGGGMMIRVGLVNMPSLVTARRSS